MAYRESRRNGVLKALLLGSLMGGATALLVAPTSGRRLRKSLARGGKKLRRRTGSSVAEIQDRGQHMLDQASESLHEIAEDVRQLAQSWSRR